VCALAIAVAGRWSAGVVSGAVAGLAGLDPAGKDAQSLVSGISMAVVLGLVIRNTVGAPAVLEPGLAWTARACLRAGILLLGFKLALDRRRWRSRRLP
jgi:uncharacterized membrane protein YadS